MSSVERVPVLPFGKHKGLPVTEVGSDYLRWCYESFPDCPDFIVAELSRRGVETGEGWLKMKKMGPSKKSKPADPTPQHKATIVGRDFDRLSAEFLRAGGNNDDCPFDTDDYQYEGPEIRHSAGNSIIAPGEFRRIEK